MALEKKEAYFQIHGGDSYSATFTPEVVDGREVYEFSAKKKRERKVTLIMAIWQKPL